ncbi:hypothetical protein GGF46_004182 [Coemansia sp. RSA 552]|nr:hypothetical protein GGF46_004182 [Coemansia sp. RSA 552]
MRFFVVLSSVAAFAAAQEIGVSGGDSVVAGTNAIDNPNVNNGVQADASLFAGGNSGGANIFHDVVGSQFLNANLNAAVQDNLANNVGVFHVGGNSGWTANGDANALGPVSNALPVYKAPVEDKPPYKAPTTENPPYKAPAGDRSPGAEKPAHYEAHEAPSYHAAAPAPVAVEHKQVATIIQNQA